MALLIRYRTRRAMLLGILAGGICRGQVFNEYQVKAAFLYAFAKFVEWPPKAFSSASAEIAICVLGDYPFGTFLDDAVRGKSVDGRSLAVYRLTDFPAGHECKILFIATSEHRRMAAVLTSAATSGVLTVGDTAEFASEGGVIGLQLDGQRIRLSVNLTAAERAKVRISSRVLSLATIIK
jgi:hypothetical protein